MEISKKLDEIVTTFITEDYVLGHNPVAALYTMSSYYSHLLKENRRVTSRRSVLKFKGEI